MSLVNAAMNTQLALDHFNIGAVFFTGIAGGIDPAYGPGDVVVPAHWHYHSEAAYFNQTAPDQYAVADWFKPIYEHFGMIFPDDVTVKRAGMKDWEQVPSFAADSSLLAEAAKAVEGLPLTQVDGHACRASVGGDGVSGTVFCDNANYRKWIFKVWKARCVDMESAAIAQVCWENKTPCLIVRGLSDLAGAQAGQNQLEIYLKVAASNAALVLEDILKNLDPPRTPHAGK
jgi:adenosylhomocysteine nucleosidase